jgi:internalin A
LFVYFSTQEENRYRSSVLTINRPEFTDEMAALIPWKMCAPYLSSIDFRGCSLTSIPIGISACTNLKSLNLKGNPLKGIFRNILDKDLLDFALSFSSEKFVPCNELKMMVVGDAGAGKTTLMHRMRGKTNSDVLKMNLQSTDGIDLGEIEIDDIKFTCWDFGGQEVFRFTHQLFLSENAVCLLLFRLTSPEEQILKELTFWIHSLSHRASGSSCFLVGTHLSSMSLKIAEQKCEKIFVHIQNKFRSSSSFCGWHVIDSIKDINLDQLVKSLKSWPVNGLN